MWIIQLLVFIYIYIYIYILSFFLFSFKQLQPRPQTVAVCVCVCVYIYIHTHIYILYIYIYIYRSTTSWIYVYMYLQYMYIIEYALILRETYYIYLSGRSSGRVGWSLELYTLAISKIMSRWVLSCKQCARMVEGRGREVAQLVKALGRRPCGHGCESRHCHNIQHKTTTNKTRLYSAVPLINQVASTMT